MGQFFAYPLFKYLKKHTYESENTWGSFFAYHESQNTLFMLIIIIILKETVYIKTIIQIDKHKVKYIITACIPTIIITIFYFL